MRERPVPPIYAHWRGRLFSVNWPEHRPDPEPGDVVRLDVDGSTLWRSFRVVGRRDQTIGDGAHSVQVAIDLDVEPIDPL